MSMPMPERDPDELAEDITFENVPGVLNLGDDPANIYLPPDDDGENRDLDDANISYLGDLEDGISAMLMVSL
ncbi:hypothetical protein BDV25DRAFT_154578 [Aspergillus avenaceus]|uniref:Uncharacterized protein n=1 Tax=Aspergillus avenaceus TaxID=36643 RepID=A0A5N6TWB3_ASPAV|nr:hypothetical protein BDV25DRAFT_154578 [Aspergillus avenaceus]